MRAEPPDVVALAVLIIAGFYFATPNEPGPSPSYKKVQAMNPQPIDGTQTTGQHTNETVRQLYDLSIGGRRKQTRRDIYGAEATVVLVVGSHVVHAPQAIEEKTMKWTYCHDPNGVEDYPEEKRSPRLDLRISDYWTNDSGVRIGLFGHARVASIFTYKDGNTNFLFEVSRASGQIPEKLEDGDRTLGPVCAVYIRKTLAADKGSIDSLKELNTIKEFLSIYKDPRFPSPVQIKKIVFPLEDRYNNAD